MQNLSFLSMPKISLFFPFKLNGICDLTDCLLYIFIFRYTSGLVARSVYTSGKSSSAAGLTATVAKEPETGEFCIEVHNLVLYFLIHSQLEINLPLVI